ncbi:MAG: hypothetical protein GF311_23775 [Candidatus Lokiarchaeota archaeon]|nr:hypothetical protein [Candidatus Lokiarchaeota archaeon]
MVHPKKSQLYKIRCYKSVFNIPKKSLDLAINILPIKSVLDALMDCIDFGVKSIIIESEKLFLENNPANKRKLREIKEKINESSQSRVMGPNSIGIYNAIKSQLRFTTSLIFFDRFPK